MEGKLIIFSAPSGAGKTTIVQHLLKQDFNLAFSISATSRKPRVNEVDGKDYYFLTQEQFNQKVRNNEFLEWEEVYKGTSYGTLKKEVERLRTEGKNVIFDVDVIGGLNIKKYYGENALAIFVEPPSIDELKNRLIGRSTETKEKIAMRLAKAEQELSYSKEFDVVITNDDLYKAFTEAENIVRNYLETERDN